MKYLATFYTHYAALCTHKALVASGVSAKLAPVPRKLSSSCGTCVLYEAEAPLEELFAEDVESLVERENGNSYRVIKTWQ